tara:strand:+ start:751 stop:1080 length:330 start_codon:yes stop_codon:yes gene_type:complete
MSYSEDEDEDEYLFQELNDELQSIIQNERTKLAFLDWVSFLVNTEEQLRYNSGDEYETRDFFALHGIEMTPNQVRDLIIAVDGILNALDFFRNRNITNDDDIGLDSEEI